MAGRRGARSRLAALIAPLILCAACGDKKDELYIRDVPDGPHPVDPAPAMSDLPPEPDLAADRKGVAMLCAVRKVGGPEKCACMADAGAAEFKGRKLSYFAARMIGDNSEAERLEADMDVQERADLSSATAQILLTCGQGD